MNKLEELAHKYAEVYDNGNMFCWEIILAALREWTEECAQIAEDNPDTLESAGGPGSGVFVAASKVARAIRAMAEEEA